MIDFNKIPLFTLVSAVCVIFGKLFGMSGILFAFAGERATGWNFLVAAFVLVITAIVLALAQCIKDIKRYEIEDAELLKNVK